jgi:activator of the mannose operon (transcriptional antiterminator)
LFVLDQIRGIEKKLDITIPYPYNINIFSHLYILLNRARKGSSQLANDDISQEELRRMEENEILYSVAKSSVNNIEKYFNIILPDIESYFIYQYLVSSRMQGNFTRSTTFSIEVIQVTKLYIEEMSSRLGIEIENETIFVDLANHIKPMLNRLEHKIRIKNSLLGQIKATYEQIFAYVQEVSYLVSQTFDLPIINDDENGFITLYFAKFIELSQNQQPIKTLIMCTTGIGTSELLRAKVAKKFPELEIIDVIASRNAKNFKDKYADIELILSTIAISEEIAIDYLLVSAMFTIDDQKRVQGKIEEIYYGH